MQNKELKARIKADKRTTAESGTSASLEQNGLLCLCCGYFIKTLLKINLVKRKSFLILDKITH